MHKINSIFQSKNISTFVFGEQLCLPGHPDLYSAFSRARLLMVHGSASSIYQQSEKSHYNKHQEPIARSLQLSYKSYVTVFLQTGVYLGFFCRKIRDFWFK